MISMKKMDYLCFFLKADANEDTKVCESDTNALYDIYIGITNTKGTAFEEYI